MDVRYVGIDLGTCRSAASDDTGAQAVVKTVVGTAQDPVARKRVGADTVVGDAALRQRLMLRLVRPIDKGVPRRSASRDTIDQATLPALRAVVDALLDRLGREDHRPIHAVLTMPASASQRDAETLIAACRGQVEAAVVVSSPFCLAYGLERLASSLVIDVGAGTVDLCRMQGTLPGPSDQTSVPYAGDYIDYRLLTLLREAFPSVRFSREMIRRVKERYAAVVETGEPALFEFPVNGRPEIHDITALLREACESILPRLLEGVARLISSHDPEFQAVLRQNVLLAGGGSQIRGLDRVLEAFLAEYGGGKVTVAEEPVYAASRGALAVAMDSPASFWEPLRQSA